MTSPAAEAPRDVAPATGGRVLLVLVASFVLGAVTLYAQDVLPRAWDSLANSSSGWTLLTAGLIWAARLRTWAAAGSGAASFVLLVLGYMVAANVSGWDYTPIRWFVIAVIAGPIVGIAATWLRQRGLRPAGVAIISGVCLGDGVYGLRTLSYATSPVYWTAVGVVGAVLLLVVAAVRIRGVLPAVVALAGTAGTAYALLYLYQQIGQV